MNKRHIAFTLTLFTLLTFENGLIGNPVCNDAWNGHADNGWANSNNWNTGCIPGLAPTQGTDVATFPGLVNGSFTVNLDADGGISPIVGNVNFVKSTNPFPYTISGTSNTLTINRGIAIGSPYAATISAPIMAPHSLVLIDLVASQANLTLTQGGYSPSSPTEGTTLELSGAGTLTNLDNDINLGTNVGNTFVQTSGNFINMNHASSGGTRLICTMIEMLNGTFTNINNKSISTNQTGSAASTAIFMTIGNSIILNTNTGTISSNTAIGSLISASQMLTLTKGAILTNQNRGHITNGTGVQILVDTMNVSQATVANQNTGTVNGGAIGSMIQVGQLNINGRGVVTNNNSGTTNGNGIGSLIEATTSIQINKGGTLLNNTLVRTPLISVAGVLSGGGQFQPSSGTLLVNNNGTVIAGSSKLDSTNGIMNITGSYNQTKNGTLELNLSSHLAKPNLAVTGAVTLNGKLELGLVPKAMVKAGQPYTIITAGSPVQGTFAAITYDKTMVNFNAVANYNVKGDNVMVTLMPTKKQSSGGGSTAQVAKGTTGIQRTTTHSHRAGQKIRASHAKASSARSADVKSPTRGGARGSTRGMIETSAAPSPFSNTGDSAGESIQLAQNVEGNNSFIAAPFLADDLDNTEQRAENLRKKTAEPGNHPWNVYFGPTVDKGVVFTNGTLTGFRYWSVGGTGGMTYSFDQVGLGMNVAYSRLHAIEAHKSGTFNIQQAHADLYAVYVPKSIPEISVNAIIGGGLDWYHFVRNAGLGLATPLFAVGNPKGSDFDTHLEFEYVVSQDQISVIPTGLEIIPDISASYLLYNVKAYTEHGAGTSNLFNYHSQIKSFRSLIGLRLNYSWTKSYVDFNTEFFLAYQREFLLNHQQRSTFKGAVLSTPKTTLYSPGINPNIGQFSFDFTVTFFKKYGIEIFYNLERCKSYVDQSGYLSATFNF